MKAFKQKFKRISPRLVRRLCASGLLAAFKAHAGPDGFQVGQGAASVSAHNGLTTVTASDNAILNWNSFNVGANETVRFLQSSESAIVWNNVVGKEPSRIYGSIEANGVVALINPAGIYFGPSSFVRAAGFVASTAPATPLESSAGLFWQFNGAPPKAEIVNYGSLNVGRGGSLFLIADKIENRGSLTAPGGSIGLLGGREALLSSRPDGRGLSAAVTVPSGAVDNLGRMQADAGSIVLSAKVVNQNGLIQADSVRETDGQIELIASESIRLGSASRISASGDSGTNPSRGGSIVVKSAGDFQDAPGSQLAVKGGQAGGDGGFVEISASAMTAIHSQVDGTAAPGSKGGRLLIDPTDIVIGNTGSGSAGNGHVNPSDPPTTLNLNVNSAFQGLSEIHLQANRNITVSSGTTWDLEASTGVTASGASLTLTAGNNITVANGASILGGQNWSITLEAGKTPSALGTTRNVALNGTGTMQTGQGDIRIVAGNNVTVGAGAVRTVGGGDIDVQALGGSINTGTNPNGFVFRPTGYSVDSNLGGISTAAGGNVSLRAGLDILSFLPGPGGTQGDAGSGAFGAQAGNVSIEAGRDVGGHFVVRNGQGTIEAGRNAGQSTRLLALSLVAGDWDVQAVDTIYLQEVRNPNGIFNNVGFSTTPTKHFFDYAADAGVTLNAGNAVELRGSSLPRYDDTFERGIPSIYPGRLDIVAGAGGVTLANDVILFPSPTGNLNINTPGSLIGARNGELIQIVVSDSAKTRYREFGDFGIFDHAATPVHLNDPNPITVHVGGNLADIHLAASKRAVVEVGGNMVNSRFDGQNLRDTDKTVIAVAGDIVNRNEFTTVVAAAAPNYSLFDLNLVYPPLPGSVAGIQNSFTYNATTHEVVFQGRMTGEQFQALAGLTVRTFGPGGIPILDAHGEPVTRPAEFIPLAVLTQLYERSQDVPLNPDTGYRLGGGGTFEIAARNLDLGATVGIVSQGPRDNHSLAKLFDHGAAIDIKTSGNLEMFSTRIASLNGGNISIDAAGTINVGSKTFVAGDALARGIYTTGPGDISVVAGGNINVNGSRIAAYDGGDIFIRSANGSVDAGNGVAGSAAVEKIYVDPVSRAVLSYVPTIPGSGILATTFPNSLDPAFPSSQQLVGDITIETPRGNINANAGGIVQLPLNDLGEDVGTVTLRAGTKGVNGQPDIPGNIDVSNSGVIGSTVRMNATGKITGLVFARKDLDLTALQDVNVRAVVIGDASLSSGGAISGTVIAVGGLSASGSRVDAALLSTSVSTSGDASGARVGFGQGDAAAATSQGIQSDSQAKSVADAKSEIKEETVKKTAAAPALTRTVGRVTVILPTSNN